MEQYIEKMDENSLLNILNKTKEKCRMMVFTEERKKEVLNGKGLAFYIKSLNSLSEKLKKEKTEAIPFSKFRLYGETGNRSVYEDAYFLRRRKLVAAALRTMLYGTEEDISDLCDIMWAICDEYIWCLPAHVDGLNSFQYGNNFHVDLFASETAGALSETIYLCGDKLPEIVKTRAMRLVCDRVLRVFEKTEFFWEKNRTNWAAVCAGSVGSAAIYAEKMNYISDEELAYILYRVQNTLQYFLEGFPSDGTCGEGISYWNYGFGYFTYYSDLLKQRTCGEIDYFKIPHVKTVAQFNEKMYFPCGRTVSFSDGDSDTKYNYGLVSYLSDIYGTYFPPIKFSGGCCDDTCARFQREIRNIFWGNAEKPKKISKEKIYVLRDPSWYIASSNDEKVSIAAKAGRNDEAHNHNDVGSFQIFKNGEEIFSDLGAGEYTKEYFSSNRYNVFCCCSRGHSVPIIGGKYQKSGGRYRASDVEMSREGISMELRGAYALDNLESLGRSVKFDSESGKVTIKDSFRFKDIPESVCERFILHAEPKVENNKIKVFSKNGKASMTMTVPENTFDISVSVQKNSCHNAENTDVYCLDLAYSDSGKMSGEYEIEIC